MAATRHNRDRMLPAATAQAIDAVCEQFERAWKSAQSPRIEDYLAEAPETLRADLFRELLALDVDYLRRSGRNPEATEYAARFPAHAATIHEHFKAADHVDQKGTVPFSLRENRDSPRGDCDAVDGEAPEAGTADWTSPRPGPSGRSARASSHPLPESIGRYQVRGVLGQGSFGTVYLAHDAELDRPVAIKSLRGERFAAANALEMLQAEARTLAKLKHPAIVAVYDVGRAADGGCFMVMEYVAGCSLKDRLRTERLGLRQAAEGVATAAEALYHAHQQGLIHRDLKPGNLLIDPQGKFHVADFGLALHEDQQQRLAGHISGTPAYMAPEQVRGETHRLDGRTDVWGLGVVLYEILTLQRPFAGEIQEELFESIQSTGPQPPTEIDPSLPRELERICLKCLGKRMAERYRTALDLANELRQWLQGPPPAQSPQALAGPVVGLMIGAAPEPRVVDAQPAKAPVVPRGLRCFSSQDRDFYLELLPGPRDRDGLPESVGFWKSRLEDIDDGDACALLYGPSGCGKSSLVKAGILPRLAAHVVPVYLEAVPQATEARLLRELRSRCPQLPAGIDLAAALAGLRAGRIAWPDRKVLIVLDQFEQWLHAHRTDTWGDLLRALRQCDGRRLQCLLLVRDDFWLATARFLQSLEVSLVEGRNVGLVDLFSPAHAKAVLTRFGQAYGTLPQRHTMLTARQRKFLDRAVDLLARDGAVVPVRLSLFADMIKSKPWLPETLEEVGGAEGLGAAFLEESFGQRTANPQRRRHRRAAESVLRALLPEHGGDLRGPIRAQQGLCEIAGYQQTPGEFADLARILDSELRLITPTDPEGQPTSPGDSPSSDKEYYQLSHDFLVPSVREWLMGHDKETWRGRARLVLEERAIQWNRAKQSRYLPSPLEYARILAGVPRRRWKSDQRAVMRAATRRYGLRAALLAVVFFLAAWGAWEANGRIQARRLNQAILSAQASDLESLLDEELPPYQGWAAPWLRQVADDETRSPDERLRASVALVPAEVGQVSYLRQRLLDCPLDIFPVVRNRLAPHRDDLADDLWKVFRDRQQTADARFRAGMALAAYRPEQSAWTKSDREYLADALVRAGPDAQREVRDCLRPMAAGLIPPLRALFGDEHLADGARVAAAVALADYAADQPELLAELTAEATATQYRPLFSALTRKAEERETVRWRLGAIVQSPPPQAGTADRISAGRRKAGAAATLLRMGLADEAAPVFMDHEDPEAITQLIHGLKPREARAGEVLAWLEASGSDQARYALLLALGAYGEDELPTADRARLLARLKGWYASEPASAVHSACGWLLRRWGRKAEVAVVDSLAKPLDPAAKRTWLVDRVGDESFCFVAFPPGTFMMGAPNWDPDHNRDETLHAVQVPRPFALGDREVTRRQYETFLRATRKRFPKVQEIAPTPDHAMMGVKWYDAVEFCRWLNTRNQANGLTY
jgi:eukaryotic-like serine/threonine-protein kinase